MNFQQLQEFRQQAYQCLGLAKDATFELADAAPDDAPRFMFSRFGSEPIISAERGQASMKRYKIVDQTQNN